MASTPIARMFSAVSRRVSPLTREEAVVLIETTSAPSFLAEISKAVREIREVGIPVIANGAHMGAPEVLKNVPADLLEGLIFIVADWNMKGQEAINENFKKRTNEQARTQYRAEVTQIMDKLGLKEPDPLKDRRFL